MYLLSADLVRARLLDHVDLPVVVDIVAIVPLPLSTDCSNDWNQWKNMVGDGCLMFYGDEVF